MDSSKTCQDKPVWFVLNHVANSPRSSAEKEVERFNSSHETALKIFAPTYVVRVEQRGEIKFRTANLTFHYVFAKGSLAEVKQLCMEPNGFSFMIVHGSDNRYATIDDRQMVHFMNIARAYKNCLPYFSLDDIDLEDGDVVEVVRGDFPGLVGTYIPNAKSKTGNIVLQVFNNVGAMAFNVRASDVRVLEFSPKFTRANDQIDAFLPRLLQALRDFSNNEALSPSLAAKLSVFCGRMEVVRIDNRKLNAKLQLLLYAANLLTGNTATAAKAMANYDRLKKHVTNEWTKATLSLIQSVLNNDRKSLHAAYSAIKEIEPSSKARKMIAAEYLYYIGEETSDPGLPAPSASAAVHASI